MKEKELREIASCGVCGKPFGHTGLPLFWRVKMERHAIKIDPIQRQTSLGMMLAPTLAMEMGPDEDMTELLHEKTITVCEDCCTKATCIVELALSEG